MYNLLKILFPICRSITGDGVRQTLGILQDRLQRLEIHEIPSGTQAFDWAVPDEWNIRSAILTGPDGGVVADFAVHNLHVMGYSEPVDVHLPLEKLQAHLHSSPDFPDEIPFVVSFYERRWGFCLRHSDRLRLKPGMYHAKIDATLAPGNLTYGELIIPGESTDEVFLSTYLCHPSLANDNLSGVVVTTALAEWLLSHPRHFTYRIVFIPETIGSLVYLSRNLDIMRKNIRAGFVLTCLGDEQAYSYLPSRAGATLADRVALHVLRHFAPGFTSYTFLDRGSDERQYCSPGVDLPVCSVMRSKYECFPQYHTSADNLDFVTQKGLEGGYEIIRKCVEAIELNRIYDRDILGEPQMGKRGLYATLSSHTSANIDQKKVEMMNLLTYIDGQTPLLEIAQTIGVDIFECAKIASLLTKHGVIRAL